MELYAVRERRGGPWNWALGLRGQAGFEDHARFMDGLVDAGFVLLGGPLEDDREVLLDGLRQAVGPRSAGQAERT